ncbi:hypothetical protein EMPS_06157 [Entomortierella parvispora]|uniref:Transcription activator GCR1-like domain-containing protein n=1 Tax=Entomortierella parvispora TaxID=205924 RepID=A0A9P3HBR0_9FUNG|nr:hypothetical protein EMPS_06157 [Entomortierella parvispora]
MDQEQNKDDIAYMSLLTRDIPGVGAKPLVAAKTNSQKKIDSNSSASTLSDNQRRAIKTLEVALEDAIFVSEGEEPFEIVHIPKEHAATPSSSSLPLPTEAEFLQLIEEMHLISEDDDVEELSCERTFDLKQVLANTHPGAKKIEHALRDIFHYHAIGSQHIATQTGDKEEEEGLLALYRVTVASSTRVHIWVLGWVDQFLVGFHTEKSRSRPTGIAPASHTDASAEDDPFIKLVNVIREESAQTRAAQLEFFQKAFGYFQEQQRIKTETLQVAQQAIQNISDALNDALEKSTREADSLKNVLDSFAESYALQGSLNTNELQQPGHGAASSSLQRPSEQSITSMERIMAGSTSSISQAIETARKRIRLADANSVIGIPSSSSSSSSPSSPSPSPASASRNIVPRTAVVSHNGTFSIRPATTASTITPASGLTTQREGQAKTFSSRGKMLSQARTTDQEFSSTNGGSSSHQPVIDLTAANEHARLPAELVPDTYEMSRGIDTVREAWNEWTIGLSPLLPSVEQMDKKHGTKWRTSIKERKFYSNRLVIIREVRRLTALTGQSADNVIDQLDREVKSTSWTKMVTRLRKEHATRTNTQAPAGLTTDDEHDALDHGKDENGREY